MKNKYLEIFVVALVILTNSFTSYAQSFEHIGFKQLMEKSDLVVKGTLSSVSRYSKNSIDYSQGEIYIDEFIWGNVKTIEGLTLKHGDKLKLTWQNPSTKIDGRIELGGSENNEVIWILTVKDDGSVTSNYFWCNWASTESQLKNIRNTAKKIKLPKDVKIIKLIKEESSFVVNQGQEENFQEQDQEYLSKQETQYSNYSYLAGFMAILISISFYWILYRSRFKIR